MKKIAKIISLLLSAVLMLAGLSTAYAAGEDMLTIALFDDHAAVTACRTYASGVIDIPSSKDGLPVTSITDGAFSDCSKITQVNIPESVTDVGSNAFENCISLKKIVFAGADCIIDSAAFKSCSNLTDIVLPSALKEIPEQAFFDCKALTSISIPSTVEVIGKEAFKTCEGITRFDIPASVRVIRKNAFLGCTSVTDFNVAGANTVYSSVNGVLYGPYESAYDTDVSSPKTDKALIQYPAGRTDKSYAVASGTLVIGDYAFGGNDSLEAVTLPNGLKTIDNYAFNECDALASVAIPSTVTKLGQLSFGNCTALKSVTIPASVTTMKGAFYKSGLTSVVFEGGIKSIGEKTFEKCGKLSSVTIPSTVEKIEFGAFLDCTALNYVRVPSSVTTIGKDAFGGCDNIILVVDESSYAQTYAQNSNIRFELAPENPEPQKTITSVSVDTLPSKTSYNYKDKIDTTGLALEVCYSDGSREIVTSGFEISPDTCTQRGVQNVDVNYEGFTASFKINVSFTFIQWIIWILLLGFLWY